MRSGTAALKLCHTPLFSHRRAPRGYWEFHASLCYACGCSGLPSTAACFCRAHTTELSKPMDSPVAPSLLWPSRGQRGGAAGASVEKNSGASTGQVGRGEPGHRAGSPGQGLPPLGRSLLRASHNGSADSLASSEPSACSLRPSAVLQRFNGRCKHMASETTFRLESLRCTGCLFCCQVMGKDWKHLGRFGCRPGGGGGLDDVFARMHSRSHGTSRGQRSEDGSGEENGMLRGRGDASVPGTKTWGRSWA